MLKFILSQRNSKQFVDNDFHVYSRVSPRVNIWHCINKKILIKCQSTVVISGDTPQSYMSN
jgi:hypothetical protein